MSAPTPVTGRPNKKNLAAIAAVGACALVCALPVLGGVLAGSFLDRVLDGPALVVALAVVMVLVVAVARRRRRVRCDETDGGSGC